MTIPVSCIIQCHKRWCSADTTHVSEIALPMSTKTPLACGHPYLATSTASSTSSLHTVRSDSSTLCLGAGKELLNDAFLLNEAGFTPDQCVVNVTGGQSNNQYTAPNPAMLAAQEAASPALLLAREVSKSKSQLQSWPVCASKVGRSCMHLSTDLTVLGHCLLSSSCPWTDFLHAQLTLKALRTALQQQCTRVRAMLMPPSPSCISSKLRSALAAQ